VCEACGVCEVCGVCEACGVEDGQRTWRVCVCMCEYSQVCELFNAFGNIISFGLEDCTLDLACFVLAAASLN